MGHDRKGAVRTLRHRSVRPVCGRLGAELGNHCHNSASIHALSVSWNSSCGSIALPTKNLTVCVRDICSIPLILMSIAYYQIVRVLWKSDTIPGHRESRNTVHGCGCTYAIRRTYLYLCEVEHFCVDRTHIHAWCSPMGDWPRYDSFCW